MTQVNEINNRIESSLEAIYGYAMKKTFSKEEAEDLSQEICLRLYQSSSKLIDIKNFNGWMWGIASNTYKEHVRKELKYKRSKNPYENYEIPDISFEDNYIEKEKLRMLYREIAHLSGNYRDAMALYYMENKSVSEISDILNVSQGMIKQYLFKSRSKVKEGINMFRENGESSFNPKKFKVHFWGNTRNHRSNIFKRKLPGNILLEAYYEPMTVEQLSVELGVSTVYLEDEIKILMENQLMTQNGKSKYQSNIIIFTKAFEEILNERQADFYKELSSELVNYIDMNEVLIRDLDDQLSYLSKNSFRWQIATFILLEAMINQFLEKMIPTFPKLQDDEEGYIWGLEKEHGDNPFDMGVYIYPYESGDLFYGIDFNMLPSMNKTLCFDVNRDILLKIGRREFDGRTEFIEEQIKTLLKLGSIRRSDDSWYTDIPCYSKCTYNKLKKILEPVIDNLSSESIDFLPELESLLENSVPKSATNHITPIAILKHVENAIINVMENLFDMSWITEPEKERDCLTTYLVLRD